MDQSKKRKGTKHFITKIKKQQVISICLILVLLLNLFPIEVRAAEITPAKSSNIHKESYMYYGSLTSNWSSPVTSYLYTDGEDGMIRVEDMGASVVVETYKGDDFTLETSSTLLMELPIFGGFYAGSQYNYLIFGQSNPEEDDTCEVVRIVKYTKDWQRVEGAGIYGANTFIPFDAGSLRMCEYEDMLYIRTCHEMYASSDGYHHQANMTICYDQAENEVTYMNTAVSNNATGYVSHSFNQFICQDGGDLYTVDHGDAYPRSIVLMKYADKAGSTTLDRIDTSLDILTFPDEIGENYTGAWVGALETSSTDCLVAYSSVDQENFYGYVKNVYVAAVGKSDFSSGVQTRQFTDFSPTGDKSASNPVLVKISEDRFLLMWEIYDPDELTYFWGDPGTKTIQYVMLDNKGNAIGDIHTAKADLSDCKPIVADNQVVWYVTDNNAPVFYSLDVLTENLTTVSKEEKEEEEETEDIITDPYDKGGTSGPGGGGGDFDNTSTPIDFPDLPELSVVDTQPVVTAPAKVQKVTAKNKKKQSVTLSWQKISGAKGYQIQYALNKKFTKKKKSKLIQKTNTTIKKLKKKKTYYFRVRAYKIKGGKKVYGKWSKVKKVKIKK